MPALFPNSMRLRKIRAQLVAVEKELELGRLILEDDAVLQKSELSGPSEASMLRDPDGAVALTLVAVVALGPRSRLQRCAAIVLG